MNDLIPIANPTPAVLFAPGGLAEILERIEQDARSVVPDVRTDKGRKAVASVAARVARSKVYLDDLGKEFVAGLKAQSASVDAERRLMRDRLDHLKAEVRKPLTDWEQAERERIASIEQRLNWLSSCAMGIEQQDSSQLDSIIQKLLLVDLDPSNWDEYTAQAVQAHGLALNTLQTAAMKQRQFEADHAELERLRAAAAERERLRVAEQQAREQRDREGRIAREAAEREKAHAEAIAKAAAEQAERERAAVEQARLAAERRAAEAEARAASAVAAERARAAAVAQAQQEESAKRAANESHCRTINRQAADALKQRADITESQARMVVEAIFSGAIPNVSIRY